MTYLLLKWTYENSANNCRKIIKVLKKKGFDIVRQSCSHIILRNEKGTRVTVPRHSGKVLHPKIVKSIMNDAELVEDDFD
ncbi:HicA toxin of bacterial toxin-antitoxin [uncultured archaeon]|nr:HicA toxin of bacterial toxin-antitoxin [uncultured archaeon]